MVSAEKQRAALSALQAILVRGRALALEKADHDKIADLLDRSEYLAALLCEERDATSIFREGLVELAAIHGCGIALTKFDKDLT
jgi:hypothetical protein